MVIVDNRITNNANILFIITLYYVFEMNDMCRQTNILLNKSKFSTNSIIICILGVKYLPRVKGIS